MNAQRTQPEKKTFSLLCINGKPDTASFYEVDGEWIEVFHDMETFIWWDEDEDVERIHGTFEVYHIVHGESGICIGRGFDKEMAIESARVLKRSRGRDGLNLAIKKTIRKYGLSPAFR